MDQTPRLNRALKLRKSVGPTARQARPTAVGPDFLLSLKKVARCGGDIGQNARFNPAKCGGE
jgi:hypothetical protein